MNYSNNKHGWLNIDKPQGLSSSTVVTIIRKLLAVKKVGHAGTLDPMATGVLPIAVGEATKTVRFIQDNVKEYEFTVKFGSSTDSFDQLGQVTATTANLPTKQQILDAIPSFLGEISQIPPVYAAIKIDGVRAYKKARAGEEVIMPSRIVHIDKLELLSFDNESAQFRTQCSKGTYIRSLAHDLAIKTNSLGHVTVLRRTMVGNFNQNNIIRFLNSPKYKTEIGYYADKAELMSYAWQIIEELRFLGAYDNDILEYIKDVGKHPEYHCLIYEEIYLKY